jgi:hypothetical protein
MKKMSLALVLSLLLVSTPGWGQISHPRAQQPPQSQEFYAPEPQEPPDADEPGDIPDLFSIPAGTHVPMVIVRAPLEGQAHEGSKIYLRTRVPLRADGGAVIPARSLVVGVLTNYAGSGFNGAGAGLAIRLRTIVLPNDSRMPISGRVTGTVGAPGGAKPAVAPVQGQGTNGLAMLAGLTPEQLAAVSMFALAGGELGYALGKNQKGTMIGSLVGAGIGMAAVMASNGAHLHLRPGTNVDAVLDEPLALDPRNFN